MGPDMWRAYFTEEGSMDEEMWDAARKHIFFRGVQPSLRAEVRESERREKEKKEGVKKANKLRGN